jgi:hypothetical protein
LIHSIISSSWVCIHKGKFFWISTSSTWCHK